MYQFFLKLFIRIRLFKIKNKQIKSNHFYIIRFIYSFYFILDIGHSTNLLFMLFIRHSTYSIVLYYKPVYYGARSLVKYLKNVTPTQFNFFIATCIIIIWIRKLNENFMIVKSFEYFLKSE